MIKGTARRRTKSRHTKKVKGAKSKTCHTTPTRDIKSFLTKSPHDGSVCLDSTGDCMPSTIEQKPNFCSTITKDTKGITEVFVSMKKSKENLPCNNMTSPSCISIKTEPICFTLLPKCTSDNKSSIRKYEDKKPHLLTDYFPVRRSNRKTMKDVKKEKQKLVEDAIFSGNEDGFEVKEFPGKGRGVTTKRNLKRGDFVLEYYGELIDMDEAKKRENFYAAKENTGCYMYYFKHEDKQYCIDATKESGRLGRLVNHSKKGNLKTRSVFIKDSPHLILVADRDISPGEELLYDYGDRSKESLESHPWLAL